MTALVTAVLDPPALATAEREAAVLDPAPPTSPAPPAPPAAPLSAAPPAAPLPAADPAASWAAAQATPRAALPAPLRVATTLVRALLEIFAGDRPARQLAAAVTPELLSDLEAGRWRRAQRAWVGSLLSVHVSEPADGVAEVCAAFAGLELCRRGTGRVEQRRVRCLALRLEGRDGRWMVTALTVG